jgi:ketosteroid isomerase-like protein
MNIRSTLAWLILFLPLAHASGAGAENKGLTSDQEQVVDAVRTIFQAARTDDLARFHSVTAADFYLFDGGARFNGDAIMALMKAQHGAGKRYEWNVTEPDVHVYGDTAWIAYLNRGSITDSSGTIDQQWLESAFLEKRAGSWKIVFMHSTRVPAPSEKSRNHCDRESWRKLARP